MKNEQRSNPEIRAMLLQFKELDSEKAQIDY